MSTSPFMTPGQSRSRRARAAKRRRKQRIVISCTLVALVLGVALGAMALANRSSGAHHDARRATSATAVVHVNAPARSPSGLVLGKPPLTLTGIGSPRRDTVHPVFSEQPRAGVLFNLSTGQVLWQHNPHVRLRMASLTKMMTALLTVQSAPADAHVLVTREAVDADGSKVGVLPLHKHVRLESMLYGLLLPSGNDAAVALAHYVAGSVKRFVVQMNAEAAKLGLGCTRYSSPSGYYDQGNYTCAADLAELAHVDLEQPRIAKITRSRVAILPFPIKGGKLYLYNNNPLLIYGYPGLTGMKTGYTEAAGRCLVATAERHGVRLGVVLLHSPAPGTQAKELLDIGFKDVYHQQLGSEPPIPAGA
jgi:serine-type D-Ala-D-Ala carboxypeptidase (penicillin-binding protein 5/6)